MANVPGQIISELGELAKDVGKQTAQVPKDIAGKALESLGTSQKTQGNQGTPVQKPAESAGSTALDQIATEQDLAVKRHMARKALEELTRGSQARQKQPSIWERLQMETEQKEQQQAAATAAAAKSQLPVPAGKRARGDLYGVQAKKTATENRNVRQD